jgi:hypothetical protein
MAASAGPSEPVIAFPPSRTIAKPPFDSTVVVPLPIAWSAGAAITPAPSLSCITEFLTTTVLVVVADGSTSTPERESKPMSTL